MPPLPKKNRGVAGLLFINILGALGVYVLHTTPIFANLENAFVDLRYWVRGVVLPDPRVSIVTIDEKSIRELGLFPWPRKHHAQLIHVLTKAGARSVAFDLLFTDRDPDHPQDDAVLGDAAERSGRIAFAILFNRTPEGRPTDPLLPVPELQRNHVGVGMVNIFPEKDGATRHLPLWVRQGDTLIPSLSLAAWAAAERKLPEELLLQSTPPVDSGSFWNEVYLNYTYWREDESTRSPFPTTSYVDVLKGRVDPHFFSGKIVLVGATAAGLFDAKSAPGAPVIYGIEIHANALNNLLKRNFFQTQATSGPWLMLILVLFAVGSWLLMSHSSTFVGGATVGMVLVGYYYLCQLAFNRNILLPYAAPILGFLATYFNALVYRLFIADREREKIRNTWSRYMSPKLVDLLIQDQGVLAAGNREVTVFFSDLAKFTTLSEQFQPSELVTLLNVYFTQMTDILIKHDITFDKYIGDCIMGYGNAPLEQPDHALQTCRAALEQVAALPSLHKQFASRGWPPLEFRIGLHTGTVLYGELGSHTRSNYTVMGDTVNVASRLEGANKLFGTKILISESTYQAAHHGIEARELDFMRVEGKKKPLRVYELVALKGNLIPLQREAFAIFSDALRLYRDRRFQESRTEFLRVRDLLPEDIPARLYVKRCDQFLHTPPPTDWDGVFVMTSK
ncbi:MAG: adenylate/guanylate cyclase domain-containing protein [Elusimicrobia bacterium]|nr:adenylate/guanylate cyclase domain-containing protein [Elusimicrobiota bacterium]